MSAVLPHGWMMASLNEVACPIRTRRDPRESLELPFIGMEHVEAQTTRLLGTAPAVSVRSLAAHFLPGDILYGRLRPYLNKVWAADREGLCSAEFIPLTPARDVRSRFLQYRLNAADFVAFATSINLGDRPRVDYDQIGAFAFGVPPSAEQDRIIQAIDSQFSRLDEAAALLGRVRRNLKRYRAAVLKAAVEGRLVLTEAELARAEGRDYEPADVLLKRILAERRRRWEEVQLERLKAGGKAPENDRWSAKYQEPAAPDVTDLPSLPEGWCWATMGALTLDGAQNGLYVPRSEYGVGTPILRIDDYQVGWSRPSNELDRVRIASDVARRYALEPGDLVVNRVNSPSHLGKTLAVTARHVPAVFESNMMRLGMRDSINATFVQHYLNSHPGRLLLTSNAKWAVNQASINQEDVLRTPIPLPPAAEQRRITAETERLLSSADDHANLISRAARHLQSLRPATLKWAFEGKLVDQDPTDEPASVLLERIRLETATTRATSGQKQEGQRRRRGRMRGTETGR